VSLVGGRNCLRPNGSLRDGSHAALVAGTELWQSKHCVCVCVCVEATWFQGVVCVKLAMNIATSFPNNESSHICYPVVLPLWSPGRCFQKGVPTGSTQLGFRDS
jgi:hypothetical protein